jgi:hypothetical protein
MPISQPHLTPKIAGPWEKIIDKQALEPAIACGQVVDHCFFRDIKGDWQAWVQVRDTQLGRIFTRWQTSGAFAQQPWRTQGICWQADAAHGESVGTTACLPDQGQPDVIQAPYVYREAASQYWLVYGGGPTEPTDTTRQICLAQSQDGITFQRVRNDQYQSRLVAGPNHAADGFLLKHQGTYHLYVGTPHYHHGPYQAAVIHRTSPDLKSWSAPNIAHAGGICGTHDYSSQSIFVAQINELFYLLKMGWSGDMQTAVYCSSDPNNFGTDDSQLVTTLKASAAELICDGDQWYISSLILPDYDGVQIAPLTWH